MLLTNFLSLFSCVACGMNMTSGIYG